MTLLFVHFSKWEQKSNASSKWSFSGTKFSILNTINIYEVWSKSNRYFKFFQNVFLYLSITILLVLFKVTPLEIVHLCQHFFQSSKHFLNALFGIANISRFDFSCISLIVIKRFPFIGVFNFDLIFMGPKSSEDGG